MTMANVALFPSGETPKYYPSVNTSDYEGNADAVINPDVTAVAGQPLRYWKRDGDEVELMTQGERDAVDAGILAAAIDTLRDSAAANFDAGDPFSAVDRAIVLVALDEVNTLRTWTRSLKTETAAASTLADFKTRVATLATLGDRTAAQARTALLAHIDAGDAD
jgi:hypothetical protein